MTAAKLCVGMMTLGCVACLHSPPNYPGAGGNNLDPAQYVAAECPNLSGRYQGVGELVEGDASAQQAARTWRISNVFPFRDNNQAQEVLAASRSSDGRYAAPAYTLVTMATRIAKLNLHFENGKSIEYLSSFEDKGRFVCTGPYGVISWGGASEGGRSEYGPNRSDSVVTLYLDPSGNLILERGMQVHMRLRLGLIPTGTAKYFAIYRFKRLPD
ncbi:hypothetical protein [Cupriavidus taiwanensis]|uniref:hypothetical protein n=1 Tax=Cupriavidus taiwanensis TaxID=164546 RepID=UPI000E107850|nr:hypothetical protein [Cupriavidus taiwanensis]SPA47546.1 putative lipoprotein [Cupriavidus taiwanensis]